jgi:hypothetical protein
MAGVPADGDAEEFRGALKAEFFADISAMDLDGLDADMERIGDLAGGTSEAEVIEDFECAIAEGRWIEFGRQRAEEGADGGANIASGVALGDAGGGAGEERLAGGVGIVETQGDDGDAGKATFDLGDEVEGGAFAHGDVEDDDVGPILFDGLDATLGATGMAGYYQIDLPIDDPGEPVADERMIIDEEDATADGSGAGMRMKILQRGGGGAGKSHGSGDPDAWKELYS